MQARDALREEKIEAAVVSVPSFELFGQQDADYQALVLGKAPRVGVEAAAGFGWERLLGADGSFVGMSSFGASAPYKDVYEHFGITAQAVAAAVKAKL
jgi:transketolase